eukprot:5698904-Prymnesium_polylepis.1
MPDAQTLRRCQTLPDAKVPVPCAYEVRRPGTSRRPARRPDVPDAPDVPERHRRATLYCVSPTGVGQSPLLYSLISMSFLKFLSYTEPTLLAGNWALFMQYD